MKYDFKLFTDKTELLQYTDLAASNELQQHLKECKDFDSFIEPYTYWFGRLNHRFVSHVYKAQLSYLATRQMFHISYIVFSFFFGYLFYNKDFLPDWIFALGIYVFMPFVAIVYFPTKMKIEFDFAQINAALFKEQALCAALIYDNLFGKKETKEMLMNFSIDERVNKKLLEDIKTTTIQYFQLKTNYPTWMKNFIRRNYEIYTNHLFVQPDSNKLINENYKAIFSHIALTDSDFGDSQQK